jgi:hypothetical protein
MEKRPVNVSQIDKFLEVLQKYEAFPKAVALFQDVLTVYRPKVQLGELPDAYIVVWDASIIARLRAIRPAGKVTSFDEPVAWVPKPLGAEIPDILFGQLRIGAEFQGSATVNQQAIAGFPEKKVVGRPLNVVAGMMGNEADSEIGPDEIPIQIFRDETSRRWIAANNRGYATHCLAGLKPLRVWPRKPDQMELNRLKEVENAGDAKKFTYDAKVAKPLAAKPHALPSRQIPITAGPNSWVVMAIAEVA